MRRLNAQMIFGQSDAHEHDAVFAEDVEDADEVAELIEDFNEVPTTDTDIEIVEDPDAITVVIPRTRLEQLQQAAGGRRW